MKAARRQARFHGSLNAKRDARHDFKARWSGPALRVGTTRAPLKTPAPRLVPGARIVPNPQRMKAERRQARFHGSLNVQRDARRDSGVYWSGPALRVETTRGPLKRPAPRLVPGARIVPNPQRVKAERRQARFYGSLNVQRNARRDFKARWSGHALRVGTTRGPLSLPIYPLRSAIVFPPAADCRLVPRGPET